MKKNRKNVLIGVFIVLILALAAVLLMIFLRIKNTKDYNEQLSLGDKYLAELNYEDAAIAFRNAIQINEKKETGHIRLSDVYIATEDYDQAADVLLTGYDATGESTLIKERIIAIYPQVSDEYKEKIEEKIEEVDTDPGQNEEAQPADPPEETTEVSIGHVVAGKDRIFYWKYSSQSYENAGALASFGSGWIASNQLVCRTADGTEQILLESAPQGDTYVSDCGTLGISGGKLFFDMPDANSTDSGKTILCSYDLETGETVNYGGGHLKAVTEEGRAIGYTRPENAQGYTLFLTNEDGTTTALASGVSQYLDYHNGMIYFQPLETDYTTARATLSCVSPETLQVQNLYTVTADFPVNNNSCTISQIAYQGDRIYFAYGSYGGTGGFYQGGKVACVNADGSGGRIASGSEVLGDSRFLVTQDGSAIQEDSESISTYGTDLAEYYTLNGNLYHYNREAGGQPDLLVEPSDYASFSGGLLGVFDNAGIHLQEAALTGDKVYYRIDSCIQNDSVSIGWRTGYSRQYSALFEKDLETGTVTELYRY